MHALSLGLGSKDAVGVTRSRRRGFVAGSGLVVFTESAVNERLD